MAILSLGFYEVLHAYGAHCSAYETHVVPTNNTVRNIAQIAMYMDDKGPQIVPVILHMELKVHNYACALTLLHVAQKVLCMWHR